MVGILVILLVNLIPCQSIATINSCSVIFAFNDWAAFPLALKNTAGPQYPWILQSWIHPTSDGKYSGRGRMLCLCQIRSGLFFLSLFLKYPHSICLVFDISSELEMIGRIEDVVFMLHTNTTSFASGT